jgi:hypothetical protein
MRSASPAARPSGAALLPVLAACLGGAACAGDKSAYVWVRPTLAVDAWGELGLADACSGGKGLCLEELVESESFTVDPPGVLEVVPVSAVPADLARLWQFTEEHVMHVVHGLAPGSVMICGDGRFNDGTDRKACAEVRVDAVARVTASFGCEPQVGGVLAAPLVTAGTMLQFSLTVAAADGTALDGYFPHPVDDAQLAATRPMWYEWCAPEANASLTFGSPLDAQFSETLETYGPDRVSAISAVVDATPPTALFPGNGVPIHLAEDVDGRRACASLPVTVTTETPDVCLSPFGTDTTWPAQVGASFGAVSEGTCRLSIGVPGAPAPPVIVEVPFYLLRGADQDRDRTVGVTCDAATQQPACSPDRRSMLACRNGMWAVTTDCGAKICDYTAPATACTARAGCLTCR